VNTSSSRAITDWFHSVAWALLLVAVAAMPMVGNTAQLKAGQKKATDAPAVVGRKLYVNNCSACHGSTGQGGEGPNLHGLKLSDAAINSIVVTGFKGEMPSFKSRLKAQDIKALIAYIRTLKK